MVHYGLKGWCNMALKDGALRPAGGTVWMVQMAFKKGALRPLRMVHFGPKGWSTEALKDGALRPYRLEH